MARIGWHAVSITPPLEGADHPGSERRFDAVLFDFGGVLTSSPFHALRTFAEAQGADPETFLRIFIGPSEDGDHPFHRAERGELGALEMFEQITAHADEAGIDIRSGLGATDMSVRHDVVEFVRELQASGYAVGLVSNNFKELAGRWRTLVEIDELFDIVVESSAVGMRKPARGIYELALERLGGLPPTRAIFLDDLEDNVHGAIAAGLHGVFVDVDHRPAIEEVRALLGLPSVGL